MHKEGADEDEGAEAGAMFRLPVQQNEFRRLRYGDSRVLARQGLRSNNPLCIRGVMRAYQASSNVRSVSVSDSPSAFRLCNSTMTASFSLGSIQFDIPFVRVSGEQADDGIIPTPNCLLQSRLRYNPFR